MDPEAKECDVVRRDFGNGHVSVLFVDLVRFPLGTIAHLFSLRPRSLCACCSSGTANNMTVQYEKKRQRVEDDARGTQFERELAEHGHSHGEDSW